LSSPHLTILGGGIAGLSVAYFARKQKLPHTLYEAEGRVGGNCITLTHGEFGFDSGAHRFHDKIPQITQELQRLFGEDLRPIFRPSKFFDERGFVDCPASPLNLLRTLGPSVVTRIGVEVALSRLRPARPWASFEDYAVNRYGPTMARRFLLNFTEKIWGIPCSRLAPYVAAKRFKEFSPVALATQFLRARTAGAERLAAGYYYPEGGIGAIAMRLGNHGGEESVRTGSMITGLDHDTKRIRRVEINGRESVAVEEVVSTIPLDDMVGNMRPPPPRDILEAAGRLRFRSVLLVAFFLDRASVTEAATLYFADPSFSITRVYEPRNRNERMSPLGKTSLVAEIPCDPGDATASLADDALIRRARQELVRSGLMDDADVRGACVHRMHHAYPVLGLSLQEEAQKLLRFVGGFVNLKIIGRNAAYQYLWMHELMAAARDLVARYVSQADREA